ncbi:hypothetical protein J4407_01310 [Candidatus Pacearchaeota archaeon]|nr:hypothetical protein [Candidatus Pacearchaeota archaeon]
MIDVIVKSREAPQEILNAKRIGPGKFSHLRDNISYKKGTRMPTMPELVQLVYISLGNLENDTARDVIHKMKRSWLVADTAVHYYPEVNSNFSQVRMVFEDHPKIQNEKIVTPEFSELEKSLTIRENGIKHNKDRTIRMPYIFDIKKRDRDDLLEGFGMSILTGLTKNMENVNKLTWILNYFNEEPYFCALPKINEPISRVAGLDYTDKKEHGRFIVVTSHVEDSKDGYTFSVKK